MCKRARKAVKKVVRTSFAGMFWSMVVVLVVLHVPFRQADPPEDSYM